MFTERQVIKAVIIVFDFLVCIKSSHVYLYTCSLALITVVIVNVEKVMAIVLLCESTRQFRALMMILQYHKTELNFYDAIPIPCFVFLRHPMSCVLFF